MYCVVIVSSLDNHVTIMMGCTCGGAHKGHLKKVAWWGRDGGLRR